MALRVSEGVTMLDTMVDDGVQVALTVGVEEAGGVAVSDEVRGGEVLPVGEPERVALPVPVPDGDTDGDAPTDSDAEGELVTVPVFVLESVGEALKDDVGVDVTLFAAELDIVALPVPEGVIDGVAPLESVEEAVDDVETVAVRLTLTVVVPVADSVLVPVSVAPTVAESDALTVLLGVADDSVLVLVGEAPTVAEPDALTVLLGVAVDDSVGVPEVVTLAEDVGVDVTLPVDVTVGGAVPVGVTVDVGVAVELPVDVPEMVDVAVPEELQLLEAVDVRLQRKPT